jgi:crotonobetainyl-CoA:carnitine CoA-transferase CaiB-like acyl-CoA transferase
MMFPFAEETNDRLPLVGLKVLDLSRLLPGPYATLMLADMGADVLKVEDTQAGDYVRWGAPKVGGESVAFMALNRNKRSIKLNLKTDEGREIFLALVQEADIVLESFRPGVMAKLGLGYEQLREVNPKLIYCAISGYGQDGPYKDYPGHDLNYMGYAGALGQTGLKDGPPVMPGVQVADLAGGAMQAVIGILAAVQGRHQSGRGRFVDVSMTDGVVGWMVMQAAVYFATGYTAGRGRNVLNGGLPEYSVYETKDGKYLSVGALEPKFFSEVCKLIGLEQYAETGTKGERAAEIRAALTNRFKEKTQAEWLELLAGKDTCVGPVYELNEVFEDPQIKARGLVVEAEHPKAGKVRQIGLPIKLDGITEQDIVRRPAPGYGEHTDEILASIGYSVEDIERLKKEGVI